MPTDLLPDEVEGLPDEESRGDLSFDGESYRDGPVPTDLLPVEVELPADDPSEDGDESLDPDEVATDPQIPAVNLDD